MAQTKVEVIRPGDPKQITFDDYKGQPNLIALVRQWITLLSDRSKFQKMGAIYQRILLRARTGKPCWQKPWLAKPAYHSSPSKDLDFGRCSGASTCCA
jgi:hypothetical protein